MVLCFIKQAVITSSQYWIMNTLLWMLWFPSRGCGSCWSYTHSNADSRELRDPMWHFPNGGSSLPLLSSGDFLSSSAQIPAHDRVAQEGRWDAQPQGSGVAWREQPCFSAGHPCRAASVVVSAQYLYVSLCHLRVGLVKKQFVVEICGWKWSFWIKFPIQLTIHQCWDLRRGHSSIFLWQFINTSV